MNTDVSAMSRRELEGLRGKIDKALERIKKADLKKAKEAAEAAARQHGFSLSDITGGEAPKKRGRPKGKKAGPVSKPAYRHPENSAVTWTGRGRRPDWIKAGLAAGKKLDDFKIK